MRIKTRAGDRRWVSVSNLTLETEEGTYLVHLIRDTQGTHDALEMAHGLIQLSSKKEAPAPRRRDVPALNRRRSSQGSTVYCRRLPAILYNGGQGQADRCGPVFSVPDLWHVFGCPSLCLSDRDRKRTGDCGYRANGSAPPVGIRRAHDQGPRAASVLLRVARSPGCRFDPRYPR